jgi:WhiB family transcriptional regulator, redox-sensing transcriptional regulator
MQETIRAFGLGSVRKRASPGSWGKAGSARGSAVQRGLGMLNDWESRAACHDLPIEWFFGTEPEHWRRRTDEGASKSARTKAQTAQAKEVCGRCPVRAECLAWALDQRIEYGIFGGATEHERRQLLAQDLHG